MQEETKEEYLSRLRKEAGISNPEKPEDQPEVKKPFDFKARLKSLFLLVLLALFLYAILQIFGMLKSN